MFTNGRDINGDLLCTNLFILCLWWTWNLNRNVSLVLQQGWQCCAERTLKDSGDYGYVQKKHSCGVCVPFGFCPAFVQWNWPVLTVSFCPLSSPCSAPRYTHSLQCLGPCAVGLILKTVIDFPHSTDVRACLLVPNTGLELPGEGRYRKVWGIASSLGLLHSTTAAGE